MSARGRVVFVCSTCKRTHDCEYNEDCHIPKEQHDRFDRCNTFDPDGHP